MSDDKDQLLNQQDPEALESCDPNLSRKEFLKWVVLGVGAGAVCGAPEVVDKFLVPPAYASYSRVIGTKIIGSDSTLITK